MSDYSIYVRPLGKPGGFSEIITCAELVSEGALFAMLPSTAQKTIKNAIKEDTGAFASVEQVGSDITMRTKGKTSWTNVTAQLTSIVFEIQTEEGTYFIRVPIFDDLLVGEYWFYDNTGLKNLQVRFYKWGTDVTYADLLL